MITTSLISASETSTETQTEVTNAIEGIIANAVSTTAKETGRLSKLISGIADKIKEALPSLIFAVIIFLIGLALSKIKAPISAGILLPNNIFLPKCAASETDNYQLHISLVIPLALLEN